MKALGNLNSQQIILLYVLSFVLYSCGQPTYYSQPAPVVVQQPVQQEYQIVQGPDGTQQAVFYDNGVQYIVAAALFNSWMNQGGYTYVVHHYHDNPSYYHRYDTRTYNNYRTVSRGSYNSYKPPSGFRSNQSTAPVNFRNTSPAAPASGFRSNGQSSTPPTTFRNTSPTVQRSGFRSTSTSSPASKSSSGGFRRH